MVDPLCLAGYLTFLRTPRKLYKYLCLKKDNLLMILGASKAPALRFVRGVARDILPHGKGCFQPPLPPKEKQRNDNLLHVICVGFLFMVLIFLFSNFNSIFYNRR